MTVPYPPLNLVHRVGNRQPGEDPFQAYESVGAEAKAALLEMLPDGWSFDDKRVLDFGCGAGRTLRQFLREADRGEFWGADIDAPSIAWLERNLCPPLRVLRSGADPPLDIGYGTFDLVWALSVFTHLTDSSLAWLLELHKLLKPDGLLIATYMGRWNGAVFTAEPWDEDRVGMNVLRRDQGWDDGGPIVLMSDWWVRARWGRAFKVVEVVPEIRGQTWLLLQKRDVELTVADLEKPSDDPREYLALRHNLRQIERDRQAALAEVRGHYESSRSWRITRPLRETSRLGRVVRERWSRAWS